MRDSQRQRVYDSERQVPWVGNSAVVISLEQCQVFVDSVTHSAWWKRRCSIRNVTVTADARNGRAWAHYDRIRTSPEARVRWIMLHELAHIMTSSSYAHGPEYCANFVALTRQFLSKAEGDALKAAMRKNRVKVRGANTATRHIKRSCAECGTLFIEGTGWTHPKLHEQFHTKACAQKWFTTKLKKQLG